MDAEEIDQLEKQMNNLFNDYHFVPENEHGFYEKAFSFLKQKEKFTAIEYRFLCWLSAKFNKSIKLECPIISEPVNFTDDDFEKKYLTSDKRKDLINALKTYIAKLKQEQKISEKLEVLVGGSFSDYENASPNDLDIVIMIPEGHLKNDNLHEIPQNLFRKVPKGIDLKFLPHSYNVDHYKAYSNISYLGNKAANKQKDEEIKNNSFSQRDILRISV